ncbi:MAG: VOC family protein [Acidimicrobiia bacterium]
MPERERYIEGVPCWVDTTQPDPRAAVGFYQSLFGWSIENAMPEGSEMEYFMASIRHGAVAAISGIPDGAPPMALWNTYIAVDDVDASAATIEAAGGALLGEPFDVMDAGRMVVAVDPEGAMFAVWQANQSIGAEVVNEHGALNFNGLATRDRAGAEAFYGAVFGWQTLDLDAGVMWTLPGYGDHLEESSPGLREQMAQMGAPDGFIDVVAALNPIAAHDAETPAHWSVTFGVDDADAIASAARSLGATIVSEPVDAPWTRTTTIADPQGAVFVASQFVAENSGLKA